MCWCDPNKRTPFCGAPNCHPPTNVVEGSPELVLLKPIKLHRQSQVVEFETPDGTRCKMTRELLESVLAEFQDIEYNKVEGQPDIVTAISNPEKFARI